MASFVLPRRLRACAALSLTAVSFARPAGAQDRARGQGLTLAANALVGGLTAGGIRALRGGSFVDGFAKGAAGGAVTYAGKRIAVESFTGAGMLGRQVSALGASTSLSAAEGAPLLSRIILAAGPVHVYVTPSDRVPLRVAIDAASVASIVYTATLPKAWIDVRESLSSGAVVFRRGFTEAELGYGGVQLAGVVQLTRPTDVYQDGVPVADAALRLAAHERVHVLQYDQAFILWSVPVEDRLMRGARWSRDVHRYVDVGLNAPLELGLSGLLPYRLRPWEREAYFLSHGSPEQGGGTRR